MAAVVLFQGLFWAGRLVFEPTTPVIGVPARTVIVLGGVAFVLASYLPEQRRYWEALAIIGGLQQIVAHAWLETLEGTTVEAVLPTMVVFFAVCGIAATRFEMAVFAAAALLAPTTLAIAQGWEQPPFLPLLLMASATAGGVMVSWFRLRSQAALTQEIEQRTRVETELREAQHYLERTNAELRRANRAKDVFLANLSHELRTPLSIIIGYQDLILEGGLPEVEVRDFIERSTASARHLLCLISDMLDLTRLEAGTAQLEVEPIGVEIILREVLQLTEVLARAKGLALHVTSQAGLHVLADPQRLKQVLLNLVGNALKFTQSGSVTVTADVDDGQVRFRVRDTGPGIPHNKQQLLFQKFVRLDTRATAQQGVGLGLSICRELVTLMGGSIALRSEGTGRGTELCVTLPRAR